MKLSANIPIDWAKVQGFCDCRTTESEAWRVRTAPAVGAFRRPVLAAVQEPSFSGSAAGQKRRLDFCSPSS